MICLRAAVTSTRCTDRVTLQRQWRRCFQPSWSMLCHSAVADSSLCLGVRCSMSAWPTVPQGTARRSSNDTFTGRTAMIINKLQTLQVDRAGQANKRTERDRGIESVRVAERERERKQNKHNTVGMRKNDQTCTLARQRATCGMGRL